MKIHNGGFPHRVKFFFSLKRHFYIPLDAKFNADQLLTKDYVMKIDILEAISILLSTRELS